MTTNTNNKLTDETLKAWKTEAIISLGETPKDCRDYSHHEAILALVTELQERRKADNQEPASERERIRREHAEWSDATFGDVGPVGPLKHLSKEALEAAAEPDDLSEWADMQFLLWDAQRRAGVTDEQITMAMVEKLAINKARQWPEPKDGEPRLHIKEQPAPVVPEECPAELPYAQVKAAADLYALCWQSGEVVTYTPDPEKATIWLNNYSGTCVQEYAKLERLQETLSGNSPVIPDDWVMVPKEPTQAMIKAWLSEVANWRGHVAGYKAALAAAPQHEVK